MRSTWAALGLLCAGWLALCGQAAAETAHLTIEAISKPCMAGTFARGQTGVHFQTCKAPEGVSLRVSTLNGDELLYIRQESGDVVISVQSRALTLRVPGRELEEASREASPWLAFRRLNAATQMWGDTTMIAELGRTTEYALLPELSYQLGKLGITGRAYPPGLPLHAIALGAAEQLGIEPEKPDVTYRVELPAPDGTDGELLRTLRSDADETPDVEPSDRTRICPDACEAFPNRDKDCYGMCGPGCEKCWPWVCGDCCYHGFCAVHDDVQHACEGSANPIACLNVLPWYFVLGGCDNSLLDLGR
jgi:hypothetical protein